MRWTGWALAALCAGGWVATCVEGAWRLRQKDKALEAARKTLGRCYFDLGSVHLHEEIARTTVLVGAALDGGC